MSRGTFPKQLLPLLAEVSLLQQTAWRVRGHGFAPPLLMCGAEHRFVVAEQLAALGVRPRAIVLEPVLRNTAPAIAAAAMMVARSDPDALMLVCPTDHAIDDLDSFRSAVHVAAQVAATGHLVMFGVDADAPEPGYGYIRAGRAVRGHQDAAKVVEFVEKPDERQARRMLLEGTWAWNSGMFLVPPRLLLDELERFRPEVGDAVSDALAGARRDGAFVRLDGEAFAAAPAISIDHAVMERTRKAAVVRGGFAWSDVGSWSALWRMADHDRNGNVMLGDVVSEGTSDCYVRTERLLVATVGLKDTIVVATSDAVLVADRSADQQVEEVVATLRSRGRSEAAVHRVVYQPWGCVEAIDAGPGYKVRHIIVKPGHRLPAEEHGRRAGSWVVVSGTAHVVRGDEDVTLSTGVSIDVPAGGVHRLTNPGPEILHLIEVQTDGYVGEDDVAQPRVANGRHVASSLR
jgi:mannose-1-phosphate guanylyltransferase/mannose-6-phosphate isomerase